MYYNLIYLGKGIDNEYFFGTLVLEENGILIAKYIMTAIGLVPIIMGATNICMLKKKYMKIIQVIFAFVLFYIAGSITDSPNLDFDVLI
jgi:hypothetical protein